MRLEDVPFSAVYQATLKSQWLMTKKAPVVFTDGTGSPEAALFRLWTGLISALCGSDSGIRGDVRMLFS